MGACCFISRPPQENQNKGRTSEFDIKSHYFIAAAAAGDNARLVLLAKRGCSVNCCDRSGRTALHLAASEGHTHVVESLIKKKAVLNVQDRFGNEPLQEALANGHQSIAKLLQQAGAALSSRCRGEIEIKLLSSASSGDLASLERMMDSFDLCMDEPIRPSTDLLQVAHVCGQQKIVDFLHKRIPSLQAVPNCEPTNPQQMTSNKCPSFTLMEACARPIARARLDGREAPAVSRDLASVMICDVAGFTSLSARLASADVARVMRDLFQRLDRLAFVHGVQKVDVAGDAYVAAANFTEDQPRDHAARLARFALAAVAAARAVPVPPTADRGPPPPPLRLRAGLHCGPVAGILADRTALKYALLGEAAAGAARLETTGQAGRVHCSAAAAALIARQAPDLMLSPGTLPAAAAAGAAGPERTFFVSDKRRGWRAFHSCGFADSASSLAQLSVRPPPTPPPTPPTPESGCGPAEAAAAARAAGPGLRASEA